MMISFGMMQPVSTAIAMDSERDNAGAATLANEVKKEQMSAQKEK